MKSVWCLIALLLAFSPLNAAADSFSLWDIFPDRQGDNGFVAGAVNQYNVYRDLFHVGPDYNGSFAYTNDGNPGVDPRVERTISPWIFMHPSASDTVILSGHPDHPELINVSGQFMSAGGGQVYLAIGTATGNTPHHLWQAGLFGAGQSVFFNLSNILVSSETSLYFSVNAGENAENDGTLLSGMITTVPTPGALLLLGSGLLGLAAWRRVGKS